MKLLFVLLIVAAAAMADPEAVRERRGILGGPLWAPSGAIVTPGLLPGLNGAVLAGRGPVLIGPKTIITGSPLVAPALWG